MSYGRQTREERKEEELACAYHSLRGFLREVRKEANDIRLLRLGMTQSRRDSFDAYNRWFDWYRGYRYGLVNGELMGRYSEYYDLGIWDELELIRIAVDNEFRFLGSYYHHETEHYTHDMEEAS